VEALRAGSVPQQLDFLVNSGEIRSVRGASGSYLARPRTTILSHLRRPAGEGSSVKTPPAAVLDALPGIVKDLPGRDEEY
jgi:hypothetical protein